MLVSTGERLTRATFTANRKPGNSVILFLNTPEMEALADGESTHGCCQ